MRRNNRTIYLLTILLICINFYSCNIVGHRFFRNDIKIGFLSDIGVLKENNFNEQSYQGLLKAQKEFQLKVENIENKDKESIEKNLRELATNNVLVIVIGEGMAGGINKISKDFADKSFAIIDGKSDNENVKTVVFNEQEGAFLMGVIAGRITKTNKVGFVGGKNGDVLERFYAGYVAGVKQVNKIAAEELISRKNARYTMDFNDENKAYYAAKELYESGCDIIFQATGEAGEGVFKAAKEVNKLAIGSDQDQAEIYKQYDDVIISSMIKKVNEATYDICKEVASGTFKSGEKYVSTLGLKDGYIDIAPSTEGKISKQLLSEVNRYKKRIIEQEFQIPERLQQIKEYKVSK